MGTLTPNQNFDHLLDVVSGWTGMHDLQYRAAPASGEDFRRGALVSLNANGEFVAGLTVDYAMPLWSVNASDDFDVNSDVGNIAGGVAVAYPATGGYEIVTTEFDQTITNYAPNTLLTNDAVTPGYVTAAAAAYSLAAVVGVVSKGTFQEVYNQAVIQFWPVYLPPVST